ncbi:uncharacterized protein BO96DRAFT_491854 [Aspergillus niger CBS 101883]|uniref:Uncharacterized protein n=2 Tax=Aspergillus niger TaxID=5061 RepID=A2QUB3_ASPNC|nr:uncharacterized protein BO96DRAFT_491854 [Aspergillus niger CBS 101883]XP_059601429.1 hypothetical protein An09g05030 [Aspergillus niger]PYH50247.1 hypothetical protein BO96DRAFT_491854 [Aspergillus niger CBS 101883]CAK40356.1 hypothetical protein An09g05030 [Aspergillus niger]
MTEQPCTHYSFWFAGPSCGSSSSDVVGASPGQQPGTGKARGNKGPNRRVFLANKPLGRLAGALACCCSRRSQAAACIMQMGDPDASLLQAYRGSNSAVPGLSREWFALYAQHPEDETAFSV